VYPLTLTPLSKALTQTANITLFFSVNDAHGNGVPNLGCNASGAVDAGSGCDFVYLEDGSPLDPAESAFNVAPVAGALKMPTVLVLQTSPSIIQNGELVYLKDAAKTIVKSMLPQQTMEIVTFADAVTPNVRIKFTDDKTALLAAIDAINSADGTSTNLYGTLDYALGEWTDGFSASGASGQLTAGLLIVITNGSDNAARQTLDSVVQARGNKRVIAVGVGTSSTLDTCAIDVIGNEQAIIAPTYQSLMDDVGQVTTRMKTLGSSIYTASYCSPKRASSAGLSSHKLTFTVKGNEAYNAQTCHNAVFTNAQAGLCSHKTTVDAGAAGVASENSSACNGNGSGSSNAQLDFTLACNSSTTSITSCCPANAPYACDSTQTCYTTAAEAAAACGDSCVLCGGTGQGDTQDNQLVPGTQIVVPFSSTGYASGQCPALWGPHCKSLQTCCGATSATSFAQSCSNVLTTALGDEAQCTTAQGTYCPTGPGCRGLETCCSGLADGSSQQSQCFSDLLSAAGSETVCAATIPQFGAYNATACPLGPQCNALHNCCAALPTADAGSSMQSTCMSQLTSAAGNETTCASTTASYGAYNSVACPLGPKCSRLKTCCTALAASDAGPTIQANCNSDLSSARGDETQCASYTPTFGAYDATDCPLGPSCAQLSTCCAGLTGTAQATCLSDLTSANGNETSCAAYTTRFNTSNATACPLGPECTALNNCCASLTGTALSNCQSYATSASGTESSCTSYLRNFAGTPACLGPQCSALSTCCATLPAGSTVQANCNSEVTSNAASSDTYCTSYLDEYCPTGTNCSALKTCCNTLGGSGQTTCYNALANDSGSESSCANATLTYCPTGPNCSRLKTCCEGLTSSARDTCESNLSRASGNESLCTSYITQAGCQ
jgi:hypothetical protein